MFHFLAGVVLCARRVLSSVVTRDAVQSKGTHSERITLSDGGSTTQVSLVVITWPLS